MVAIHEILLCKFIWLKSQSCNLLDKSHVWPCTEPTYHSELLSEVYFLSDHLPPRKEVGGRESRGQRVLASENPPTMLCLVTLLIKLELMCGLCKAFSSLSSSPLGQHFVKTSKFSIIIIKYWVGTSQRHINQVSTMGSSEPATQRVWQGQTMIGSVR